ncbi:MAG TPA: TonB C-terminal domain-containing protein [Blastocatellia bacterium]|nr:TonB C-terminal domain-containing protein [Blastocatellia bacterium]
MEAWIDRPLLGPIPKSRLDRRLRIALSDAFGELTRRPADFLRTAFLPDRPEDSLLVRLGREIRMTVPALGRHPLELVATTFATEPVGAQPRRLLLPVLAFAILLHVGAAAYIVYSGLLAPFMNVTVVNKPYERYKVTELVPLRYPRGMLRIPKPEETLTLDEIRERDRKRREELARQKAEREKAEKERLAKEEEERRKAAEELAKKQAAEASQAKFGEINEAPLKDLIGQVYSLYLAGNTDVTDKFSVMASFKIEPDGSISNIVITKSSGSKIVDEKAKEILWTLGQSHAVGPLHKLSSATIRLDLNESIARLTITAFAPTPEEARGQAQQLNLLLAIVRLTQKSKSPDVAELLSLFKIKSEGNRVDADLTVSRARASEMMHTKFGAPQ